jgi:hypothetical protein
MPTPAGREPIPDGLVLTRTTLKQLGYAPDFAERAAAAGDWQKLAAGTYLSGTQPATDTNLAAAARAHIEGDFLITGVLALRALHLRWLPADDDIRVLVPEACRRLSSHRVHVARCHRFSAIETWTRYGERFADPTRAVIDAARATSTLRDVRGIVLGAVADGWAEAPGLRMELDAGRRNGSALTRRAVLDAERGCASPPEAELVDELVGRGRPFYVNPELWLGGTRLGSPDVWLVGAGTGGEVDSQERHGDDDQVANTYDRHERITTPGLELVHLSVRRIRRDVSEAADHLLARAASGPMPPAGLTIVPRGPLLR